MVAGGSPAASGWRLRCAAMQRARSRRVGARVILVVLTTSLSTALLLAACQSGDKPPFGAAGAKFDEKAACATLDDLRRSSDALNGVDVGDPEPALAALDKAVSAYSAALSTFERIGPSSLRASARKVRAAVVARHFTEAVAARAPIDAWAARHCTS
jgi:hypothetical protein